MHNVYKRNTEQKCKIGIIKKEGIMKKLDLAFFIISWFITVILVACLCDYFHVGWAYWVFGIVAGWYFGKYLAKEFQK